MRGPFRQQSTKSMKRQLLNHIKQQYCALSVNKYSYFQASTMLIPDKLTPRQKIKLATGRIRYRLLTSLDQHRCWWAQCHISPAVGYTTEFNTTVPDRVCMRFCNDLHVMLHPCRWLTRSTYGDRR